MQFRQSAAKRGADWSTGQVNVKRRILWMPAAVVLLAMPSGCGLTGDPSADSGKLTARHLDMETVSVTHAGDHIDVTIDKLAKKEHYTIRIDSIVVTTGKADHDGEVDTWVKVPDTLHPGKHLITAIGELPNRKDTDRLRIKKNEHIESLKISLDDSVSPGGNQKVKVSRLLDGEGVKVSYDGTLVSPPGAEANDDGKYTITFPVGTTLGDHKVDVVGSYDGRSKSKKFEVEN